MNASRFILFTLGEYYKEANSKLKEIRITISKVVFIDLIMCTNITKKKQRTIYKNLEDLEKIKLVSYEPFSKRFSLFKVKAGENFNHRRPAGRALGVPRGWGINTLSISRIKGKCVKH